MPSDAQTTATLPPPEWWCVVANAAPDSGNTRFRPGAKVWLMLATGGALMGGRGWFYGLSPGGRPIECWMAFKHLENFRAAMVPPKGHRWKGEIGNVFYTKEEAERMAQDIVDRCGGRSKGGVNAR